MYVEFTVPEAEAALLRERMARGRRARVSKLLLDDRGAQPMTGKVMFVDNAVETAPAPCARAPSCRTRTRSWFRASSCACASKASRSTTCTVPRRAVMSERAGQLRLGRRHGEVVEMRPVRLARHVGDVALITEGLKAGERVMSKAC